MNNSSLFDEHTFYPAFLNDLKHAQSSVLIENPFITIDRMKELILVLQELVAKGINIYVITPTRKNILTDFHCRLKKLSGDVNITAFKCYLAMVIII
jgi:hypothetical protein